MRHIPAKGLSHSAETREKISAAVHRSVARQQLKKQRAMILDRQLSNLFKTARLLGCAADQVFTNVQEIVKQRDKYRYALEKAGL